MVTLLVFVLGLIAAGYATISPPNEYRASATVSVEPASVSGSGADVQVVTFLMPTLQAQVQTAAFEAEVRQRLPQSLANANYTVSSSVGSGTGLLTISITSHNKQVVAPVANGSAAVLIAANPSRAITLRVLSPAHDPGGPQGPRRIVTAVTGAVLAVVAAVLAALIAEAVARRRRPTEEIRSRYDITVLGEIPVVTDANRLVATIASGADSPALEALIALRTNIGLAIERGRGRTICITSARSGEGRSTTALGLAWALSEIGTPTVLVEADLRQPSLAARMTGVTYATAPVASSYNAPTQTLRYVSATEVSGSGPDSKRMHPADVVAARVPGLLRTADAASVVVIDAPAVDTPEATLLMRMADWTVIVLDPRRRGAVDSLEATIGSVRAAGREVLGVVLNHPGRGRPRKTGRRHAEPSSAAEATHQRSPVS